MSAGRGGIVAVLGATVCVLGAGAVYVEARGAIPAAPLTAAVSSTGLGPDAPPADWCAPGFEPIAGGGCFAPASAKSTAPLVVYLHGRYSRDAASEEVDRQRRLALRASALGFAVLALRGRLGTCTAPGLATWYCWPSNATNADAGPDFVETWAASLAAAQDRAGSRRRFVLGFSNGAYFAGLIASRGLLTADAFVVAHGGPVEPVHALHGAAPLLLLSADDDVAQDEMIRFDEELARERWAHDSYARAGGHGLTDSDIDAALAFFSRAHEALPLQPPLPLHRAIRHVRDDGGQDEIQTEPSVIDAGLALPPEPGSDQGDADDSVPVAPSDPGSGGGLPADE